MTSQTPRPRDTASGGSSADAGDALAGVPPAPGQGADPWAAFTSDWAVRALVKDFAAALKPRRTR